MSTFRISRLLRSLVPGSLVLAGAVPLQAADANPLTIDPDLAIFTLIVFVLLLVVLRKFAWKPILAGLEKRERTIADDIAAAERANQQAQQLLAQYQQQLDTASQQVQEMLAEARREADASRERILAQAQEASQRERERALAEIALAKNLAIQEITQQSVQTAVGLASRIVRRELRPEDHAQLIKETLDGFPSAN